MRLTVYAFRVASIKEGTVFKSFSCVDTYFVLNSDQLADIRLRSTGLQTIAFDPEILVTPSQYGLEK